MAGTDNDRAESGTGTGSEFIPDVRRATAACLASPLLIVLTVVFWAGPTVLNTASRRHSLAFLGTVALVVEIATIGFFGAQRVWLFQLLRGDALSAAEAYTLTKRYFRRFFSLGVLMALVMSPALIAIIAIEAGSHSTAAHNATLVTVIAGSGGLLVDILFTFVVPELTFRAAAATEAWRSGTALLRATWPGSGWYAFAPGVALFAAANAFGGSHRAVWAAGVESALAAVVALIFKGAILAYYLRLRPDISN